MFGRGAEEAQAIADAGIPFEVVPGITSAIAGPAYAGIPMTHRAHNSHVTFFTGHEDPAKAESAIDYATLAKLGGTQVMLMGVERLGSITSEMLKQGVRSDLPVALVRSATTGKQETLTGTLADIAQKAVASDFKAPAVAVFGEVVALRDGLNWYEKRPLLGKRIVVTRTRNQASVLSGKVRALGVTTVNRWQELPAVPALAEFLPGYQASVFFGLGAPKNTRPEIIDKLNQEINAGLDDPKIKARLADLGAAPLVLSAAAFGKLIADETEKWAKVIRTANIKPD